MADEVRYAVAELPGDGVGPEVTAVARDLVDTVAARRGFAVDWRTCPLGAKHYHQTGEVLPDAVLAELRTVDAVLLGAVGDPSVPPGVLERGLLLRLRAELDLYINLRPSKLRPGVGGAVAGLKDDDLDLVIVRENTEGLYAGAGGTVHRGTALESATEESLNTRGGVERCVRYAAALAQRRSGQAHAGAQDQRAHPRGRPVAAHRAGRGRGDRGHPGLRHVDAACLYMVADPARFDVIVTDNLFGDILSDLGAALTGGLGVAPSGNLNPDRTGPSIFEPVHGSAPDIAGRNLANPAGAVLSAALMLDHLGQPQAAADLDAAVEAVLAAGAPTATDAWEKALADGLARRWPDGRGAGRGGRSARHGPARPGRDLRHHPAGRLAAGRPGPDRRRQAARGRGAGRARRGRHRGRLARVQPEGRGVLRPGRGPALAQRPAGRVRRHPAAAPPRRGRPQPGRTAGRADPDRHPGRQGLDAARRRGAAHHPGGEPGHGGRVGGAAWPPRAAGSSSTPSTSSTATGPTGATRSRCWPRRPGRARHSRAVRHQRRHAARRGGPDPRRGRRGKPGRARRALPQRRGLRGGQLGAGRRRRRGARPGRGQRLRRAVRQRRPVLGHRQPGAEARPRAAAAGTARASWPDRPGDRRAGQPAAGRPAALRRLVRVRHQGGAARLGHRPAPGRVLARRPGAVGNQPQVLVSELAGRSNVLAKAGQLGLDLAASPTWPARSWTRSRRPSTAATRSRPRTPRSSCWSGAPPGSCRPGSTWRATGW